MKNFNVVSDGNRDICRTDGFRTMADAIIIRVIKRLLDDSNRGPIVRI